MMKWSDYIDEKELRKTIKILKPDSQLFEVRIIGSQGGQKKIISGYFTSTDTLIKEFDKVDVRGRNIYITLNEINPACYSREQHDKFLQTSQTTSDSEITRYQWLFVDLDPIRPTGISSTNEELKYAEELLNPVQKYLAGWGFSKPIIAASGNGYHLLYRINIENTVHNKDVIDRCLKALSHEFDNDHVKIDTTNFNPARICKLHGTLAQKGADTKDRPHRMSRIISVSDPSEITNADILEALAEEEKSEEPPATVKDHNRGEFDLIGFLHDHGMTYKEDSNERAKIFLLDECPFDASHKNGDSKIFLYPNGAISFKCHHNSCRQYRWQDVRKKFEPDAYDHQIDDARIDAGYQQHKQLKEQDPQPAPKKQEKERSFRKLKTADSLLQKDIPDPVVYVGVDNELPLLVEGTCILSAKPKLGKSWLALAMCLAVSTGKDFLGYKTKKCSTLYLDLETSEAIQKRRVSKALNGEPVPKNFYLETETDPVDKGFVPQIENYLEQDPDIGLVVVDVFQIIRSPAKGIKETEYEHAYRDITPLNELAQRRHISIVLVCHDRKAVDADDPFANILGSTGLQGAATQMIVMFRAKKNDPIHISVKGKTIDGLPELNVKLDNAEWSVVEGVDAESREREELLEEYKASIIRKAIVTLIDKYTRWEGRCSKLIGDALEEDIAIEDSAKKIGGFLHKHQVRFRTVDGIEVRIINNGTGPKIYKIYKSTIDTIDGFIDAPLINYEDPYEIRVPEELLL